MVMASSGSEMVATSAGYANCKVGDWRSPRILGIGHVYVRVVRWIKLSIRLGLMMSGDDSKRDLPLCSTGYKDLLNTCRIPKMKSDIVRVYDPSAFNHCIVACKGYLLLFLKIRRSPSESIAT